MSVMDFLFGRPLASYEEQTESIGAAKGIPIFGLDALGSAAYGPEAALTLLLPLGLAGIHYIVPISLSIIVLLSIVCFSYLQTIPAYPAGGGSYTVASENLGANLGLLAAAALMIDYVLVVAVGVSAGIGALISALPKWQPYTLPLCLATLLIITLVNLRGVSETGAVFLFPTYIFVACLFAAIGIGLWKTLASGGHPMPIVPPPKLKAAAGTAGLWLLLKTFSSGCTAMTGVEAVSNGVQAFREPRARNAQITLITIIAILILMLAGIAVLCRTYNIGATEPGQSGYESVLSQLLGATAGRGWFYWVSIASILLVLVLQANTAFADFPRVCRAVAHDGYLPRAFANRGRRLVYSHGIYVLVILAAGILILFEGVTDRLIPLFAIGAFLAFTLSQAGMVMHWKRQGGPHARHSMFINGLGALVTAATTAVVMVSKFAEGAWVTVLLIPAIVTVMKRVHRHYDRLGEEILTEDPLSTENLCPPVMVVPMDSWTRISQKALRFALSLSDEVIVVRIDSGEEPGHMREKWPHIVEEPARRAGLPVPKLEVIESPYRFVIGPLLDFILKVEREHPDRQIAVVLPNLVEQHWYHRFLHNQRAELLTALLLVRGGQRIEIVNVPWYSKVT
ncbi:MAG: APC family permease [Acidobacteriia bacterium]|nr:APC family permease [Terriglobia bacterium]MBV8907140.1 APC family permease [Terriglobia bacterium]